MDMVLELLIVSGIAFVPFLGAVAVGISTERRERRAARLAAMRRHPAGGAK